MKKLILFGQSLGIIIPLIFAFSFDWKLIILALIVESIAVRIGVPSSNAAISASLSDDDRATGNGLNSSIISLSAIIASFIGAYLVVFFGGINVNGIRPLFIIQIFGNALSLFTLFSLEDIRMRSTKRTTNFFKDTLSIFKKYPYLKIALLLNIIKLSSMQMLSTFTSIYLVEQKGADAIIIGTMMAITSGVVFLFAMPSGRISDLFGRKNAIYFFTPFILLNYIIIIIAPGPEFLLIAAFFDGFGRILMEVLWGTLMFEIVPLEAQGRWIGMVDFFAGIGGAITTILVGLFYDIAPESILFIAIFSEILILLFVKILDLKKTEA